jgi:hypothetical protein
MTAFEPLRELIAAQLDDGATYAELATVLNDSGTQPPKGGQWSAWSAYNAARKLGLSSTRRCKAQPRASETTRKENLRRVTSAITRAVSTGGVTEFDLRSGAIQPTAQALGISTWSWRLYRHAAMRRLGMQPPATELRVDD